MTNRFLQIGTLTVFAFTGYIVFGTAVVQPPLHQALAATLQMIAPAAGEEMPPPMPGEIAPPPAPAEKAQENPAILKKMPVKAKRGKFIDKDTDSLPGTLDSAMLAEPVVYRSADVIFPKTKQEVQAVLVAKNAAVISSTIDARLIKFPLQSGDVFEKGDVLAEYDCRVDAGRLKEALSRTRLSEKQFNAYKELKSLDAVANIELASAEEAHRQNEAIVDQVRGRLSLCTIKAPFRGRVTNKMASQYEFVQTGRVLMEIVSREPLQVEFLVPSIWLRWLNTGTPIDVYVQESGKTYSATVTRIHGEVDPVSQSVQVTGEIDSYQEELLPGMSGRAIFSPENVRLKTNFGFLGLMLSDPDATGEASP